MLNLSAVVDGRGQLDYWKLINWVNFEKCDSFTKYCHSFIYAVIKFILLIGLGMIGAMVG